MNRWHIREHYQGLTFIKTVGQVAEAAATREGECRKIYEEKLVELRSKVSGLSVDEVLSAASASGFFVTPEVADVMAIARGCASSRALANEYGFVAAQLRGEPDPKREMTLSRVDMSLFEPIYMQRFLSRMPGDVVDQDDDFPALGQARVHRRHDRRIATIADYVAASKTVHGSNLLTGSIISPD